jgi:hypothetical protein
MIRRILAGRIPSFATIGLVFYAGYLAHDLRKSSADTGQLTNVDAAAEYAGRCIPAALPGNRLASLSQAANAMPAAQARPPSCIRPTNGADSALANKPQETGATPAPSPATSVPPDADEAERIRQDALDAFVSGTHLREIMASEAFGRLAERDQDLAISGMVQLVNDGLVTDDLIYGP